MLQTLLRRGLFGTLCFFSVGGIAGIAQQAPAATSSYAYDTVSIHPSKRPSGMSIDTSGYRYSAHGVTLWDLMYNAYPVRPSSEVPGLPGWAHSDRFDVDAVMDEASYAALQKLPQEESDEQHNRMLQKILADRFKLAIHTETKVQPVYALVVAKGGAKLKPAEANKEGGLSSWDKGLVTMQSAPISMLLFSLSDTLDREVVDKTGLTGLYTIKLKWTPDEDQGKPDAGPTLFTAIEEQLGLKFKATKGPVTVYVVDHAEKPEVN